MQGLAQQSSAQEFHSRVPGARFQPPAEPFTFDSLPDRVDAGIAPADQPVQWDIALTWLAGLLFSGMVWGSVLYAIVHLGQIVHFLNGVL